ncbi:MAG TPA: GNAT family N-acetyltransferase [Oculatellaceae cyanobacterium]
MTEKTETLDSDEKVRSALVRPLEAGDEAVWCTHWLAYCEFYKQSIPDEVTKNTWERILSDDPSLNGLAVLDTEGKMQGFAHYVLHPGTWSPKTLCYLEDLFVSPLVRGAGFGRAVIDHLLSLAHRNDWDRLYWVTENTNTTARRLYDRYTEADEYVRYVVRPSGFKP